MALTACQSPPTDEGAGDARVDPPDGGGGPDLAPIPRDSPLGAAVVSALSTLAPGKRGRTWEASRDNALVGDWLLQTPPAAHIGHPYAELAIPTRCTVAGCAPDFELRRCTVQADCTDGGRCADVAATVTAPGQAPLRLCTGHSDVLADEMYRVITAGEHYVDLTSLQPPDGRYEAALRNAITYLGQTGREVQVRLVFGAFPVQGVVDSKKVLQRLTRDLPATAKVKVYVGNYRSSDLPPSWNHSKIIVADGKLAIVGGHNLWAQHYLQENPVHDLSLRLRGSAAAAAQRFANEQWTYLCGARSILTYTTGSIWANRWQDGLVTDDCPPAAAPAQTAGPGDSLVIAMGRLAGIDGTGQSDQSDAGILALIGAARRSVRLSQQDLGPPTLPILGIPVGSWPEPLFDQLGAALVRGVDVYVMLSNTGSIAGKLKASEAPYSNGWTMIEVAAKLRDHMIAHPPVGAPTGAALKALLCQHLHVAPLRFSADETFPDGVTFPNHAKLVLVDDQAFFVGSQNLYNAGLTEFGFMVDDSAAAGTLRRDYWDPLWAQSARRAVTGSETQACAL